MKRLVAIACLLLALAATARAAPGRYAIIVGDNLGDRGEVELRYAESDARRVATVLRSVGAFYPENILLLTGVSGDDLRRALIRLNAGLRQAPGGSLLFVFYSGHADADSLHLHGTRLSLAELRDLAAGSPAEARILVLDSCRSGALTRVKGGRSVPGFEIRLEAPPAAQGLAILTSSAAGEDSQESEELRASIFTHHLSSALLGAADRDGDGRISIDEAFTYSAERTLASTAHTLPGPQHPTYRLELGGRGDLILTEPGLLDRRRGSLAFAAPGTYLVQSGGPHGPLIAELTSPRPNGRITVEAGDYFVTQRNADFLRQGPFSVSAGATTSVSEPAMRRVDYARVVRKGTVRRNRAVSAFAQGGVRGELLELGVAWRTELGVRVDLRPLSLELRLAASGSGHPNQRLTIASYETAASLAGLHVFDFAALSLGVGLEAGLAWFAQRFSEPGSRGRDGLAGFLAPLLQFEVPLAHRVYLRLDGALLTYFLRSERQAEVLTALSYRATGGLGVYF